MNRMQRKRKKKNSKHKNPAPPTNPKQKKTQKTITHKFISSSAWLAFHLYWVTMDRKILLFTSENTKKPYYCK